MADTLLMHYDPGTPDQAVWSLVNAQGELTSRLTRGTLEEAAEIAAGHRTVVLFDARYAHLNHVRLPTSNRQKLLRAVPYALEEQIAEDVDEFHFVIGRQSRFGTAVAGMRRGTLDDILDRFRQASIRPDAMIPDALCLPESDDQWSVLLHQDLALMNFGDGLATTIDAGNLELVLQGMLRKAEQAPDRILLFQPEEEEQRTLFASDQDTVEVVQMTYNSSPLVVFCGHYQTALGLNLLQGAYKPRSKQTDAILRWRMPAALAACWLVLYLGNAAYDLHRLEQSNEQLSAQIRKIYKDTFPESRRVINARVQMEQKLDELRSAAGGGGSDFLSLLTESVDAITAQEDISIASINYRNQRMSIDVNSSGLQSVESLNSMLDRNPKLKSELSSATSENNKVRGSIRLQRSDT